MVAGPDNKGVVLQTKRRKRKLMPAVDLWSQRCMLSSVDLQKPATMFAQYPLVKDRRRSFRSIRKLLGCAGYRQDLIEVSAAVHCMCPMMTLMPVRPVVSSGSLPSLLHFSLLSSLLCVPIELGQ